MKQLPENWTENTEANEDFVFLTQEERDTALIENKLIKLEIKNEYNQKGL